VALSPEETNPTAIHKDWAYWYYPKFLGARESAIITHAYEKTRILPLEQFPPLCLIPGERNISAFIADYFVQFIRENEITPGCCLVLPPLESLTRFFQLLEADIRRAFLVLKLQGHQYDIPGYYGHITLWICPSDFSLSSSATTPSDLPSTPTHSSSPQSI
jgi:hypothetical protein